MSLVLKAVEIVDSASKHNGKVCDVVIEKGIITQIGDNLTAKKTFNAPAGTKLSSGWIDLRTQVREPGAEHEETVKSLLDSALYGGITQVGVLPNTTPSIDNRELLENIYSKATKHIVGVLPMAAATKGCKGEELSEMMDLNAAGAVAFTDGGKTISHSGILLKSLQYLQPLNKVLIDKVYDTYLAAGGQVHEGINSTLNGLKGIPSLAETLAIKKVLAILEYAGGKFHFSCISAKESVELIKVAKKAGLHVTCDVAAHQLAFDDSVIGQFDANYKVKPPFRTKEDIKALQKGLAEGIIDACVSDHTPHVIDSKELEFDLADFGIIGTQTLYPVLASYSKLTTAQIVEKLTTGPRQVIGLPKATIEVGEEANITLFSDTAEWVLEKKDIKSKSFNTPFIGVKLKGKAIAVVNKGEFKELV